MYRKLPGQIRATLGSHRQNAPSADRSVVNAGRGIEACRPPLPGARWPSRRSPAAAGSPPFWPVVQGLRNCRKLLRHKSNRNVIKSQYREMKNLYTLYYLHRLNTVVNLGMLGKISSYPTYPIAVILKMAMHLEDPERTAFLCPGTVVGPQRHWGVGRDDPLCQPRR